jgi:Ca-activated chloride channel family protein
MDMTHAPNRNLRRQLLAAVLSLSLLAAACGDDDASSDTSSSDDSGSDDDASSNDPGVGADDDTADDDAPDDGFFRDEADSEGLFAPEEPRPDPSRLEANTFEDYGVRPFVDTDDDPLSTFALDVDTGSYTVARRWLREGVLPEPAAIRVEELVNAFDYDYDAPRSGLDLHVAGAPSPFDDDNVLVRVGIQAEVIDDQDRANAALTFVVDTSGSMDRDDRLGLVKESLHELVDELDPADTVAIVIYGNDSSIVLEPTEAADDDRIHDAIDDLRPGGSTNLEAGLRTGYQLAESAFLEGVSTE